MNAEKLKRILQKEFAGRKLVDFNRPSIEGTFTVADIKKRVLQLTGFNYIVRIKPGYGLEIRDFTLEEFLEATKAYFNGVFKIVDNNAPDGAWMQMHLDLAESALKDCPTTLNYKIPEGINEHKIVEYYLENR